MIRAIVLLFILYTGPGSPGPTRQANDVITIIVPAALAASPVICTLASLEALHRSYN